MGLFATAAVMTVLFLGGFQPPYPYTFSATPLDGLIGLVWFGAKVGAIVFFYIWIRGTLPRFRYDQLMYLGWKIALPLAFLNLFATAVFVMFNLTWWQMGLAGLAAILGADLLVSHILWRRRCAAA